MKGTVLAICLMVLVGQLSAFPNTVVKARAYKPGDDLREAQYYKDLVAAFDWKSLLEHVPGFLFPILEKILKGIARSEEPGEIIKAILTGSFSKKDKRRRRKKKKEPEPEPEPEPED